MKMPPLAINQTAALKKWQKGFGKRVLVVSLNLVDSSFSYSITTIGKVDETLFTVKVGDHHYWFAATCGVLDTEPSARHQQVVIFPHLAANTLKELGIPLRRRINMLQPLADEGLIPENDVPKYKERKGNNRNPFGRHTVVMHTA